MVKIRSFVVFMTITILVVSILIASVFGLKWLGLGFRGFFGPKSEAIEREIFEETRSYNQAKLQELARYRLEYLRSEDGSDERKAIASTVRLRFADYDPERLPDELSDFLQEINR